MIQGGRLLDATSSLSTLVVTPRFDVTLTEYLQQTNERNLVLRQRFVAQILEAVSFLHTQSIVHLSLGTDSFLVDIMPSDEPRTLQRVPRLLLSNFSRSRFCPDVFAAPLDVDPDFFGPFPVPPEVRLPGPEPSSMDQVPLFDMRKLDSWQIGVMLPALFDSEVEIASNLSSENDLQVMEKDVSIEMDIILHLMLRVDPSERLAPSLLATMTQIYLWKTRLTALVEDLVSVESCPLVDRDLDSVEKDLVKCLFERNSFTDLKRAADVWGQFLGDSFDLRPFFQTEQK